MLLPTPLPDGLYETMQGSTVAVAVAMVETVVVVVVVEVVVEDESMMVVTVVVTVVVLVADSVCYTKRHVSLHVVACLVLLNV